MKYIILKFTAILSIAFLFSCSKIEITDDPNGEGSRMTFAVSHEVDSTRASLSGKVVNWADGDEILILTQKVVNASLTAANGSNQSKITGTGSGPSVPFSGTVTAGAEGTYKDYFFALYPYNCSKSYPSYLRFKETDAGDSKKTKLSLFYCPMGTTQFGVKDDFSLVASPVYDINKLKSAAMYGIATTDPTTVENKLSMKNAYAIIKFRIEGSDVTQVDFKIGDKEIVAMMCSVCPEEDPFGWSSYKVVPWSGQGNSKTLRVIPKAGAGTFEPGTYYVSLAPVSGIPTVYVHKNGKMATLTGKKSVTLQRNHILPIGAGTTALDELTTDYKDISDETITLDFSESCPFTDFPIEATAFTVWTSFKSGEKEFGFYNKEITSGQSTFHYDEGEKCLVWNSVANSYSDIKPPIIDGKRIASIEVTVKSKNSGKFYLGSNEGGAAYHTIGTTPTTTDYGIIKGFCLYTSPTSIWYFKPANNTNTYYIQKIKFNYSQN